MKCKTLQALLATAIGIAPLAAASAQQTPTTAPSGDWFAPQKPATSPAGLESDATVFARVYPRLARADAAIRATTPRVVFDAMGSRGKPALKLPVMVFANDPVTATSRRDYLDSKPRDPFLQVFDERAVRIATVEASRAGASLCFDIETLPFDLRQTTPEIADRSARLIAQAVGWARAQNPNIRLFFYSGFPVGEYYAGSHLWGVATTKPSGAGYAWWQSQKPNFLAEFAAWQKANVALVPPSDEKEKASALSSLSSLFDASCPPLYLNEVSAEYYPEVAISIQPFARSTIDEARRYNKPVYPFVCFYMLETQKLVPLDFWITLLREITIHADGVILWDGINPWDGRKALRARVATLLADRQGKMKDAELFTALTKDFPNDAELKALAAAAQQTLPPAR